MIYHSGNDAQFCTKVMNINVILKILHACTHLETPFLYSWLRPWHISIHKIKTVCVYRSYMLVRLCNSIKFEIGWNLVQVLKIVAHTVHVLKGYSCSFGET